MFVFMYLLCIVIRYLRQCEPSLTILFLLKKRLEGQNNTGYFSIITARVKPQGAIIIQFK